jgi:hypothetical protein
MRQPNVISFNLAKAREAVRKAKLVLLEAEKQFDEDCGVGFSLPLVNRIRAAERRLERARAELRRIDPNSAE